MYRFERYLYIRACNEAPTRRNAVGDEIFCSETGTRKTRLESHTSKGRSSWQTHLAHFSLENLETTQTFAASRSLALTRTRIQELYRTYSHSRLRNWQPDGNRPERPKVKQEVFWGKILNPLAQEGKEVKEVEIETALLAVWFYNLRATSSGHISLTAAVATAAVFLPSGVKYHPGTTWTKLLCQRN